MVSNTKIEWTEASWNPVTGCTKISNGCKNCYAFNMAKRLKAMGNIRYCNEFNITFHEDLLNLPLKWKNPKKIFVNSMSDLFHEDIPFEFIMKVFETMEKANWHTFQVLTKRSERLEQLASFLPWPDNVWIGVTVEDDSVKYRIDNLRSVPSKIKFLSLEPLLSDIVNIDLNNIDWVIVGGESGPGARPIQVEWVRNIRDECLEQNVPFFFKQWGGVNKKKTGRLLDDKIWDQYPRTDEPLSIL